MEQLTENSSSINDGAVVTLMSNSETEKRQAKKLASIKSWASCGVDPALMGTGQFLRKL